MSTLKILTASRVEPWTPFWSFALYQGERDWGPVWKNNTTQIWDVYLHPNMVKKKSLTLKLRFFLVYNEYTRGSMILPPRQPRLLVRLPRWQLYYIIFYICYILYLSLASRHDDVHHMKNTS